MSMMCSKENSNEVKYKRSIKVNRNYDQETHGMNVIKNKQRLTILNDRYSQIDMVRWRLTKFTRILQKIIAYGQSSAIQKIWQKNHQYP